MQAGDDADTFFIVLSGQLQVRSYPRARDRGAVVGADPPLVDVITSD
jgi:hypothetical protein